MDKPPASPLEPKERRGLVLVITGHGKGKTTAALGMALRASGHGLRTCMIQFLKGDVHSGEREAAERLGGLIEILPTGKGFCGIRGDRYPFEEHRRSAQDALALARERMAARAYDLLILDEVNNALHLRLVDLEQVLALIGEKPPRLHLVLTGRDAHPEVMARADTVTEVVEVKHAFHRDIAPQPGIDY